MLFKSVMCRDDLVEGQRYINVELHRIYKLICVNPVGRFYMFENIDDCDDTLILKLEECLKVFRKFNFSDFELRVLLCSSMMDFLELMFDEVKNKNKGD